MRTPINGPVDTAVRILCNLDVFWTKGGGATRERLRLMDLFVVFAGHVGGPRNVHPSVPGCLNAWTFRERHVDEALALLERGGIVAKDSDGVWRRNADPEEESYVVDTIGGPGSYAAGLDECAVWLKAEFERVGEDALRARMMEAVEASGPPDFSRLRGRFEATAESYRCDLGRLEAIGATAWWIRRNADPAAGLEAEMSEVEACVEREAVRTASSLRGLEAFIEERKALGPDPRELLADDPDLSPDEAEGIVERLKQAHSEEGRRYHGWSHVLSMLKLLSERGPADWTARRDLILAVLFHDAVYDPRASDNELRSADLASALLGALPSERLGRVRSLILATDHRTPPGVGEEALIADLDLAVLGAPAGAYDRYAAAVREEYAHVDDGAWREGRPAVLRTFLDRPTVFLTPAFADLERPARENLEREIAALSRRFDASPG